MIGNCGANLVSGLILTWCQSGSKCNRTTSFMLMLLPEVKQKLRLKKVYWISEWQALHPIQPVRSDIYKFHCLPCRKNLSCHHEGLKDHCKTETHLKNDVS